MKDLPQRKPIRLQGYDYSNPGYYFVTVCTRQRGENILAEISGGAAVGAAALGGPSPDPDAISGNPSSFPPTPPPIITLTTAGKIVEQHIKNIDHVYQGKACIDRYVIMPDHIHLIIRLYDPVDRRGRNPGGAVRNLGDGPPRAAAPTGALPDIVNTLKGLSTKKIGYPIWQRGYYEHIVRHGADLENIRQYIQNNPQKWISGSL